MLENDSDPWKRAEDLEENLIVNRRKASENVSDLISGKHILTMSYSSTVKLSLKGSSKVSILESRPLMEGRKLAAELIESGVKIRYWCDSALLCAQKEVDAALVGADAFSEDFFVNKVGTNPLALCCHEYDVPLYVVSDSTKYLPKEIPLNYEEEHDPSEVWERAPPGIDVNNPYFEKIPWNDAVLVTEMGINEFPSYELSSRLKRSLTEI